MADVSTADGQLLRVRTMGQAVLNAAGDVTGLHGVVQDLGDTARHPTVAAGPTKRLDHMGEHFAAPPMDDRTIRPTSTRRASAPNATDTNLLQQFILEKLDASGTGTLREHMQVALASQRATEF